jgi:hypothetical protein
MPNSTKVSNEDRQTVMTFRCHLRARARTGRWASLIVVAGTLSTYWHLRANDARDIASLNLACTPIAHGVRCRLMALFRDVSQSPRDVTAEASWQLNGAAGAQVSSGGVITASQDGDTDIAAQYQGHRVQARARLRPTGPGQMLATLRGRVYHEVEGTLRPVTQAQIKVVSGPNAGLSTTTAGDGSYELAGLMSGDAVIRASKTGYAVTDGSIQIHPGENRLSLLTDSPSPTKALAL